MTEQKPIHTWLTDMDGVLVHEEDPIPGAAEFIEALKASGLKYLLLTNNSIFTRRDLRARLLGSGIDVPEDHIFTSALATADFLDDQRPGGSAYVLPRSSSWTTSSGTSRRREPAAGGRCCTARHRSRSGPWTGSSTGGGGEVCRTGPRVTGRP